jgi:hypothetical protein
VGSLTSNNPIIDPIALYYDATSITGYVAMHGRMNDELERIWKDLMLP